MSVEHVISRFRGGFPPGHTEVTREGEARLDTGVDFGIHRFGSDESFEEKHPKAKRIQLSDVDRELIIRYILNDDRVVFGGAPISGPPQKKD